MTIEDDLKVAFLESYERTGRELGYWGRRFKRSLEKDGARATAKRLLKPRGASSVTDGLQNLKAAGREELSVEAIVLQERFRKLFTEIELAEARGRLGWSEPLTIASLANQINSQASNHRIGQLQEIRRTLRGFARVPTHNIFTRRTIFEDYAFHVGGRSELQFNIGIETIGMQEYLRHGVAFSLEPSQSLPSIEPLLPKIDRFNEFLRAYPDQFGEMAMWEFVEGKRGANHTPFPIPSALAKSGVFIFLGKLEPRGRVRVQSILDDFDSFLPLYEYVQGHEAFPNLVPVSKGFHFSPGNSVKPSSSRVSLAKRTLDKTLRHNDLQQALYEHLAEIHGAACVGTEHPTGNGTLLDVVVRHEEAYWFYEIKTSNSARACIREALAQLLEYSYWPGSQEATRLVIVGEPELDIDARNYLEHLNKRFSLPVCYQQFTMSSGKLIEDGWQI